MSDAFAPTFVIGLGGTGYHVLSFLKNSLIDENKGTMPERIRLVTFDTTKSQKKLEDSQQRISGFDFDAGGVKLDSNEFVSLGGDLYRYLREVERSSANYFDEWVNIRELFEKLPRASFALDEGSGRSRSMSRIGLFLNLEKIYRSLERNLSYFRNQILFGGDRPLQVCVVGSLAGGTGSSLIIDFPIILLALANYYGIDVDLRAFVILPTALPFLRRLKETEANAYAAWRELDRILTASPENPQTFRYPGSVRYLHEFVLDRPAYDQCYVFDKTEQLYQSKAAVYPLVADSLLLFTELNSSEEIRNVASNLSYEDVAKTTYSGVGVYSIKNSSYWFWRHLGAKTLLAKLYEEFQLTGHESGSPRITPPTIPFDENDSQLNQYELSKNFLSGLRKLKDEMDLDLRSELLIPQILITMISRVMDIDSDDFSKSIDLFSGKFRSTHAKHLLAIARHFPYELKNEIYREQIITFGRRPYEITYDGYYKSILSENTNHLLNEFVNFLYSFANNLFQKDSEKSEQVNLLDNTPYGYLLGYLKSLRNFIEEAYHKINESFDKDQLAYYGEELERQKVEICLTIEKKSKSLFGRIRLDHIVNQLIRIVEAENLILLNYFGLQEVLVILDSIDSIIYNFQEKLEEVVDYAFLKQLDAIASESLNQHRKLADQYRGIRTETLYDGYSNIDGSTYRLPIEWKFEHKKQSSRENDFEILVHVWLHGMYLTEVDRKRNNLLLIENATKWVEDSSNDQYQFYDVINKFIESGDNLFENSKPWLQTLDHHYLEKNHSYMLIMGKDIRSDIKQTLPQKLGGYGKVSKSLVEINAQNISGITFAQFLGGVIRSEIETLQGFQTSYYEIAQNISETGIFGNHILPVEVKTLDYEKKIAIRTGQISPLSIEVVQLLQDEQLLILFLRALSQGFVETNRNELGEVWYQLSYPDIREEIYLTNPERTAENPIYKVLEAASTFIHKGEDVRTSYRETKIEYSSLGSKLISGGGNLQSVEEFDALFRLYENLKTAGQNIQNSQKQQEFTDFVALIDVIIQYQLDVYRQTSYVEQKPVQRIADNYVVSKPLTPKSNSLFVGRRKYFETIENIWRNQLQKASIVLYGQRRMGKTSLLYQLGERLGSNYITILVDFQGLSPQLEKGTDFWRLIAKQIHRGLGSRDISVDDQVNSANVVTFENFDDYLFEIEKVISVDQWVVILIDEFEKIEEKIDSGIISKDVFDSLRHIIQHRDKIILLLAGHHTLQERMKQYWNPLMETAVNVKLTFLTEEESRQLIVSPWSDYLLRYDDDAVEKIIKVCGGQPLLNQLVCKGVIRKVNQKLQEIRGSVSPKATLSDVEYILQRIIVATDHDADAITFFFDAVWNWLREEEKKYLVKFAQKATSIDREWITTSDMELGKNVNMLERLVDRDVLEKNEEGYRFRIDLLKQWVISNFSS